MLSYDLSPDRGMPLYEQLYRCLREDIHKGTLRPGEKLPSRRALAAHLGISEMTVDHAYGQLLSEGYIQAESKRGYYISTAIGGQIVEKSLPTASLPEKVTPETHWLADFTSNETPAEQFPFTVWSRLIREMLSMRQEDLLKNPPPGGRSDLRQAISGHLRSFRGLSVDPEQIIVGAGTEYLYGLLVQLLGTGEPYAVEEPGYRKAAQVYRSHGARVVPVSMDADGLRVDLLEQSGAAIAHVSPSHHFPTGRVMSAGRRWQLLQWAAQGERYIIEDDYDSEFRLAGLPIPALQSADALGRVIYMNTFTKTLASTIRVSYMVLPPALLRRYRERLAFYSCTVSSIEQATLAAFISRGYFEKHLNRTRNRCRKKRDLLLSGIKSRISTSQARIAEEDAGLHFLLTLHTDLPDETVTQQAARLGLRLRPISAYYHVEQGPAHCFIINYSSIPEERIPQVCEAVAELVEGATSSASRSLGTFP